MKNVIAAALGSALICLAGCSASFDDMSVDEKKAWIDANLIMGDFGETVHAENMDVSVVSTDSQCWEVKVKNTGTVRSILGRQAELTLTAGGSVVSLRDLRTGDDLNDKFPDDFFPIHRGGTSSVEVCTTPEASTKVLAFGIFIDGTPISFI